MDKQARTEQIRREWETNPRWKGVVRNYVAEDVENLKGSVDIEYTLAKLGAERLWNLLKSEHHVKALGAITGNQAVQMIQAGLRAIYMSGWQVAGDNNLAAQTYPDQSLYPANSVPNLVKRMNNALLRADQIAHMNGDDEISWLAPIVADAEAGFGGLLNAHELMKSMIEAGAAAVHFEDQVSSLKKCGHMGGKVLDPAPDFIRKLNAARLASDIMGTSTLIVARTDALGANLLTSDIDPRDHKFLTGNCTPEGFYEVKAGLELAVSRALSYAPYADVVWCETSRPDVGEAREFAQAIKEKYPDKMLAYNCSPSFNWSLAMGSKELETFQEELGEMGYKFQFVTLAGFHALNTSMFELANAYKTRGMAAYSELQQREFELEKSAGYKAVKHQAFVGAGYFDEIQLAVTGGESSTTALKGSTEEEQF